MDATFNDKDSQSKGQWQLYPEKKNIQLDLLYLSVSTHAVMDQFRHQGPVELILDELNLNCECIIIYHSKKTFYKILALGL